MLKGIRNKNAHVQLGRIWRILFSGSGLKKGVGGEYINVFTVSCLNDQSDEHI